MKQTLMTLTPATGLSSHVAMQHACTTPAAAARWTGLSFAAAGTSAALVAVHGARVIDLPGSPPRGAPV